MDYDDDADDAEDEHLVEFAKPRGSSRGEDGGEVVGLLNLVITNIVIIIITRPWPAFRRLGLGGSSGGYSSRG